MTKNIFLMGTVGSEKNDVAKALVKQMRWTLADTDEEIVNQAGLTIEEILAIDGEEIFCQMETATLQDMASGKDKIIVCSDSVVKRRVNVEIMKKRGLCVLLETGTKETAQEYKEAADYLVAADEKTPREIAKEISDFIKSQAKQDEVKKGKSSEGKSQKKSDKSKKSSSGKKNQQTKSGDKKKGQQSKKFKNKAMSIKDLKFDFKSDNTVSIKSKN